MVLVDTLGIPVQARKKDGMGKAELHYVENGTLA